jgi:hypothetical protein
VAITIVVIWIGYLWLGQQLIRALYHSENSWLTGKFMAGRASTPLEAYYRHADAVLAHATLSLVVVSLAMWLLLRNARGLLLFVFSCFVSSFLLFCLFEIFPALVPLTHLDNVLGYYAYKANYIPDQELIFREKPFNRRVIHEFTGTQSSLRYGIEVQPYSIEWIMDKDGFRNQRAVAAADIVVLGDSYIEYGANEADTFVGRLEEKLAGMSTRNLGKSGYSVGQYVQVLKRYGLQYKPKVALMAFYEGNDVAEVSDYLLWKSGRTSERGGYLFKFASDSLWRRYAAAVGATTVEFKKMVASVGDVLLQKFAMIRGYAPRIHPDVAMLNLNGRLAPKLFIDKAPDMTVDQMLATEEFQAIRKFFSEFRELCRANRITPLILYIPTALQVYAPYTAQASGAQWLAVRDRQIALRRNTELAIKVVADESGVDLISLTPVFGRAAAEGKLVYYALDAHWNAEGREIAARFVADVLKKRSLVRGSKNSD